MTKTRISFLGLLAVAVLTVGASRAEAAILAPGGTTVPPDILFPGGSELDSVFHTVGPNGAYTANLASAVYRNAAGRLDFYYQVAVTAGPDDLRRAQMNAFANGVIFVTNVFEILNGSAVACAACPGGFFNDGAEDATTADRSANGRVVGFNYTPPGLTALNPGETTLLLLIRTNAITFTDGRFGVIDGETETRDAFQPLAVPEPASLTLFGLGLLVSAGALRRRWQV